MRNFLILTGRRTGKTQTAINKIIISSFQRIGIYYWVGLDYKSIETALVEFKSIFPKQWWHGKEGCFIIPNGSRIYFRSGDNPDNIRGSSLSGCVIDEAAHLKPDIYHRIITPALKDKKGWCFMASTPNGFSNWYAELYNKVKNDPDWFVFECPSWISPLIDKAELEKEKELIGLNAWNEQYGGQIVASGTAIFKPEWFQNIMIEEMPKHFARRMIGVDLSTGGTELRHDYQAIVFTGWIDNVIYVDCIGARMPIDQCANDTKDLYYKYRPEFIVVETNGFQTLFVDLLRQKFGTDIVPIAPVINKVPKQERISSLALYLAKSQVKILNNPSGRLLLNMLRDYPAKDVHDDIPDALSMAISGLTGNAFL